MDATTVFACMTVPAVCCVAYSASRGHPAALLAYAGSLSAGLAFSALARRSEKGEGFASAIRKALTPLRVAGAVLAASLFSVAAWGFGFWIVIHSGHAWNAPGVSAPRGLLLSGLTVAAGLFGAAAGVPVAAGIEGRIPSFGRGTARLAASLAGAVAAGAVGIIAC